MIQDFWRRRRSSVTDYQELPSHVAGRRQAVGSRSLRFESLEDRRVLATVPTGFTESIIASNLTSPIAMTAEPSGHRMWVAFHYGRLGVMLTNFGGGQIIVDGQPHSAPLTTTRVVNSERTLRAPATQLTPNGELATFIRWIAAVTTPSTALISTGFSINLAKLHYIAFVRFRMRSSHDCR